MINTRAVCDSTICDNGGTCVTTPGLAPNVFQCLCTPAWTGELCDYPASKKIEHINDNGVVSSI